MHGLKETYVGFTSKSISTPIKSLWWNGLQGIGRLQPGSFIQTTMEDYFPTRLPGGKNPKGKIFQGWKWFGIPNQI